MSMQGIAKRGEAGTRLMMFVAGVETQISQMEMVRVQITDLRAEIVADLALPDPLYYTPEDLVEIDAVIAVLVGMIQAFAASL